MADPKSYPILLAEVGPVRHAGNRKATELGAHVGLQLSLSMIYFALLPIVPAVEDRVFHILLEQSFFDINSTDFCTASLSHLRTMLPESSSRPLPAKRPNHAT